MGIIGIQKPFKGMKLDKVIKGVNACRRKREEDRELSLGATQRTKACETPEPAGGRAGTGADVADRSPCSRPAQGAAVRVRSAGGQAAVPDTTGC